MEKLERAKLKKGERERERAKLDDPIIDYIQKKIWPGKTHRFKVNNFFGYYYIILNSTNFTP